ncbi:endocuticle structural glycoprotein SgAbd-3-like [Musca domestica]|uniref:Endocuticle structural glycoprotein SgAbd-3-like n=1 Tax=Musca domestica TaxID=7370 RepID=A0ABM3USS8_MUSDO|nr:endocuticle structural glycoprotein SgAbd-3-like [Musca domestica]
MKLLLAVVGLALVGIATAKDVEVISNEAIVEHDGKYHYHYELGDGSKATQDGILKHVDDSHEGEAIQGRFAFVSDDGEEYSISYTADENGYRPVGAHLPTPPPIPESVLKTLKYLEEHPYNPENDQKKHR